MSYIDLSTSGISLGSGASKYAQLTSVASGAISLSGANVSLPCKLSGIDDPASSRDAVNLQYLQQYVLGQIRGLSIKPSASLCATTPTSLTLAAPTNFVRWAGPYSSQGNQTLATMPSSNGVAWPANAYAGSFTFALKLANLSKWVTAAEGNYTIVAIGDATMSLMRSVGGNAWTLKVQVNGPTYATRTWALNEIDPTKSYYFIYAPSVSGSNASIVLDIYDAITLAPVTSSLSSSPITLTGTYAQPPYNHIYLETGNATFGFTASDIMYRGVAMTLPALLAATQPSGIVDGVTLTQGMRVLLTAQTGSIENGIYVVSGGSLVRAPDLAAGSTASGSFIFIDGTGVNNERPEGLGVQRSAGARYRWHKHFVLDHFHGRRRRYRHDDHCRRANHRRLGANLVSEQPPRYLRKRFRDQGAAFHARSASRANCGFLGGPELWQHSFGNFWHCHSCESCGQQLRDGNIEDCFRFSHGHQRANLFGDNLFVYQRQPHRIALHRFLGFTAES